MRQSNLSRVYKNFTCKFATSVNLRNKNLTEVGVENQTAFSH